MKVFSITAAIMLALFAPALAQSESYDSLMKTATEGFEAEDWRKVATALDAAQAFRPYSQLVARNRVLAYAMLDDFGVAQRIVEEYADRGLSLRLTGHPGFERLTSRPEFAGIADRMAANLAPMGESHIVFEIADDGLLPESLASTRTRGQGLVGSARTGKILRPDGSVFAVAPASPYGLETVGDTLWAAVNFAPPFEKASPGPSRASLVAYSLADASLIATADITEEDALLGDLEATPFGIVASNSHKPQLFILRTGDKKPTVLAEDPHFVNLQGVAFDRRRNKLFVADYLAGIFAVDLATGAVAAVDNGAGAHLGGIDGLSVYKGDLIGIQNGTSPQRIVKIKLDRKGGRAESLKVLVQNHAQWNEPTNGVVVGSEFHYIATSNWPAYGADGAVDETVERSPLRVMSVSLKRK